MAESNTIYLVDGVFDCVPNAYTAEFELLFQCNEKNYDSAVHHYIAEERKSKGLNYREPCILLSSRTLDPDDVAHTNVPTYSQQ